MWSRWPGEPIWGSTRCRGLPQSLEAIRQDHGGIHRFPHLDANQPADDHYAAVFPLGMAVDKNPNSPYYGRVVVGCATSAAANGVIQNCGFYKFNADGTPADEGSFGYANYTTNDAGQTGSGEIAPATAPGFFQWRNPSTIRIGEDDRIYWRTTPTVARSSPVICRPPRTGHHLPLQ